MAQRQDVDDGIADATLALLRTKGPRSVTVESVAARSGIAKTTIYRRYRDRRDMLSAALSRVTTPEPLAVQADAPDRLRWLIKEAVKTVEVGIGFGGLAALLTDEDPAFTKLFRRILAEPAGRTGISDRCRKGRRVVPRRCRRRDTRRRRGRRAHRRTHPHGAGRCRMGSAIVRSLLADRAGLNRVTSSGEAFVLTLSEATDYPKPNVNWSPPARSSAWAGTADGSRIAAL